MPGANEVSRKEYDQLESSLMEEVKARKEVQRELDLFRSSILEKTKDIQTRLADLYSGQENVVAERSRSAKDLDSALASLRAELGKRQTAVRNLEAQVGSDVKEINSALAAVRKSDDELRKMFDRVGKK